MMNLMKNKIFSVLVGLLAVFLGACSDDDDVLTTSSVHVNGGAGRIDHADICPGTDPPE